MWTCHSGLRGLVILGNPASLGGFLALVFAAVGPGGLPVHFTEDELADSAAYLQLDRQGVGVVELQGDPSLEAGIDPAGVLDKQPHAPDRAATLDKGGQPIGHLDIFQGGGQQEGMGGQGDLLALKTPVANLRAHREAVHAVLIDQEEVVAEPAVDGGRLDGVLLQGLNHKAAAGEHFRDGFVGENHLGQPAQGLRPPSTPLVVIATASADGGSPCASPRCGSPAVHPGHPGERESCGPHPRRT